MPPLAVEPIGFRATGGTLGVPGIEAEDLPAAGLQPLAHGKPVAPGRCQRDGGHATTNEPVGQGVKGGGARAETAHGLGVAPRRPGDPGLGVADVEASGVGVADREGF